MPAVLQPLLFSYFTNRMSLDAKITQYPTRATLHNEIHARPPEALEAPLAISHVVMMCDAEQRQASREHVATLLRENHLPPPEAGSTHIRMDLGQFRIRWELHTEFVSYTFTQPLDAEAIEGLTRDRAPATATDVVPREWLSALPGQCLCAVHVWVLQQDTLDGQLLVKHLLHEDTLVGGYIGEEQGQVFTDFAIHADNFSRMLLLTAPPPGGMTRRRLGRMVQRLLEIETYRMGALMGLPAAREAYNALATAERELAELAQAIRVTSREAEAQLLDRLTTLAGRVESQHAATHSRFSASAAYFELVDKRISDIAESRMNSLQTIGEFMERRLTPARSTCEWATRRQAALSQRVSRISNLLRTRVEIMQQQNSQALLGTMNRRQALQLKLQSTVEGLSVAAITYYIVGLVAYLAKGLQKVGWPYSAEVTAALAIPCVALGVWWSLRRMHKRLGAG